jgi:uncharacterized protein (DUF305 family)
MFLRNRKQAAARRFCGLVLALSLLALTPVTAAADGPGRGLTAEFEVEFLKFTIDHHFAALRITELAAGTDATREAEISPNEGTAQTPSFGSTPAKAALEELKSLARRNNRVQREEILAAQRLLRQWYNVNYEPRLRPQNRRAIEILEQAAAGQEFDIEFMEVLSRHHFVIARRALECLVSSELRHDDLKRLCRGILEAQVLDIDEMRHFLCRRYNICDYQPLGGVEGRHS